MWRVGGLGRPLCHRLAISERSEKPGSAAALVSLSRSAVQRLHDSDPRQHFRPIALGDQQQRFHRDCQSAASCSVFGSASIYLAASRSVNNSRPSGK
ncbi:hypothetical protein IVB22_39050 [Bradyrhizobium sp. 190]|uniref:hypothetical protein n=1 Tax=Bradyrhizobium sp. 190 TaxID=2782658 RepID=UPI0027DF3840|nr:hypothetical protein [Bradyrhizobium sp. 190]MCK1518372.1 hypothetical protein [Bradyrhizobium sp. 190]